MAGFDYAKVNEHLVRTEVWSNELKEVLQEMLIGTKYVRFLEGFGDGNQLTIPSLGELPVRQADEDSPATYDSADTGEFTFSIDRYPEVATFISDRAKQDSFYYQQLIGAPHRFIASGTTNTTLSLDDFAKAKFSLDKASAYGARVAIIDPSQEYVLNTLTNLVQVQNNPQFEGIVTSGMTATGSMRFIRNIYGFDVYVSNFLATPTDTAINADARGSISTPANPRTNIFMAVGGDLTPFVGAWRQMPRIEYERNKDMRRDEYVMNARYGLKLYRPECLVSVISRSTI